MKPLIINLNSYILGQLTLTFDLTCSIKLGKAPTNAECQQLYDSGSTSLKNPGEAGRKRRETDDQTFTQTTG